MSIGSRLREEREKLEMKQEDFAIACGVRRRAQSSYESGTRSPDANYLEAASKIGVDISYVIYGEKHTFENALKHMVVQDLYYVICAELGLSDEDAMSLLEFSLLTAHELYKLNEKLDELPSDLIEPVKIYLKQCQKLIQPASHDTLDADLLGIILEHIEIKLLEKKTNLQSKRKASLIAMLYRAFKVSGKVDLKMIEEVIDFASQSAV